MIVAVIVIVIVIGLMVWLFERDPKPATRTAPSHRWPPEPFAAPAHHPTEPTTPSVLPTATPTTATQRFHGRGVVAPRPPQPTIRQTRPRQISATNATAAAKRFEGKVGHPPSAICVITLRPVSECTRGTACEC